MVATREVSLEAPFHSHIPTGAAWRSCSKPERARVVEEARTGSARVCSLLNRRETLFLFHRPMRMRNCLLMYVPLQLQLHHSASSYNTTRSTRAQKKNVHSIARCTAVRGAPARESRRRGDRPAWPPFVPLQLHALRSVPRPATRTYYYDQPAGLAAGTPSHVMLKSACCCCCGSNIQIQFNTVKKKCSIGNVTCSRQGANR